MTDYLLMFDLPPTIMAGWPSDVPTLTPVTSKHTPPKCFCGADTVWADSAVIYNKSYGMRWICSRFPTCRGNVGAHPDGRPLGSVPTPEVAVKRQIVHDLLDPLWDWGPSPERPKKRNIEYENLAKRLGIPKEHAHVGKFDQAMCDRAILILEGRYRDIGKPFPNGHVPVKQHDFSVPSVSA